MNNLDKLKILSGEDKKKYTPIIERFIRDIESGNGVDIQDLTYTNLNMYTLGIILQNLGYKELQSSIVMFFMCKTYGKDGCKNIVIRSDAETFMLTIERE